MALMRMFDLLSSASAPPPPMRNRQDAVLAGSAPIAAQWLCRVPDKPARGTTAKPSTAVGREASSRSAQQQHSKVVEEIPRPAALSDLAPEFGSIFGPWMGSIDPVP